MAITITIAEATAELIVADLQALAGARYAAPPPAAGAPADTTPPVVDANAYPFAMPEGVSNGAAVSWGVGPDILVVNASNNPGGSTQNQFVIIAKRNGKPAVALTGPLTVTSNVGMTLTGAQVFTVRGTFPDLENIQIVGVGDGLSGLWMMSLTVNYVPWLADTDAANSRGSGSAHYGTAIFNSSGTDMLWLSPDSAALPAPPPPPPPAPPLTMVDGSTLETLLATSAPDSEITLPAGVLVGAGAVSGGTVTGAGMGKTTIDVTGMRPYQDKAALVFSGPGIVVRDLTIKGAKVSDGLGANAGGVRDEGPGIGGTLERVEITGCNNGIMTAAGTWTMTDCKLHGNGTDGAKGRVHEMYFGGDPTSTVTLNNTDATCGPGATHALKSRAGTTHVTGGVFIGNPDPTGATGGSVIDVPDGGDLTMTGGTSIVSTGAANTQQLGYGMESGKNPGRTVTITDWLFDDQTGRGTQIQAGGDVAGAKLVLVNCTYKGVKPYISGFANVDGELTQAA